MQFFIKNMGGGVWGVICDPKGILCESASKITLIQIIIIGGNVWTHLHCTTQKKKPQIFFLVVPPWLFYI